MKHRKKVCIILVSAILLSMANFNIAFANGSTSEQGVNAEQVIMPEELVLQNEAANESNEVIQEENLISESFTNDELTDDDKLTHNEAIDNEIFAPESLIQDEELNNENVNVNTEKYSIKKISDDKYLAYNIETRDLEVFITDGYSPIEDAEVTMDDMTVLSNSDGIATFSNIPTSEETHTITVNCNYGKRSIDIVISNSEILDNIDDDINKCKGTISYWTPDNDVAYLSMANSNSLVGQWDYYDSGTSNIREVIEYNGIIYVNGYDFKAYNTNTNKWIYLTDFGVRDMVAVNGHIYAVSASVFADGDEWWSSPYSIYRYDIDDDIWQEVYSEKNGGFWNAEVISANGKIYYIGGEQLSYDFGDFEERNYVTKFNTYTNTYDSVFAWGYMHGLAVLGDESKSHPNIYYMGDCSKVSKIDTETDQDEFLFDLGEYDYYDIVNKCRTMSYLDNKLYVMDGLDGSLKIFDLNTGILSEGKSMPSRGTDAKSIACDGKIYLFLKKDSSNYSSLDVYNPKTDTWQSGESSEVTVTDGMSILYNKQIYAFSKYGKFGIYEIAPPINDIKPQTLASGENHVLYIDEDGKLFARGDNTYGQLGTGDFTNRDKFVEIKGPWGNKKVVRVETRTNTTFVITEDGNLYGWGDNSQYQLGNGKTTNTNTPTFIDNDVVNVVTGKKHTVALKDNGDVYGWGSSEYGQLAQSSGYLQTAEKIYTGAHNIGCGDYNTFVIDVYGDLYAVGYNSSGQLGVGNSKNQSEFLFVMDNVSEVTGGTYHTVMLDTSGNMYTCGSNSNKQLGTTKSGISNTPIAIGVADNIYAALNTTAYMKNGVLYQCGGGINPETGYFVRVGGVDNDTAISLNKNCYGLTSKGTLLHWGLMSETDETLSKDSTYVPQKLKLDYAFKDIDSYRAQTLAIDVNGDVWSWGEGYYADGTDQMATHYYPVKINGLNDIVQVERGKNHNLALDINGDVWAWGSNTEYAFGNVIAGKSKAKVATKVTSIFDVKMMAAGEEFSIFLKNDGTLWGVGKNNLNQIMASSESYYSTPIKISDKTDFVSVASNALGSIAIDESGNLYSWGNGSSFDEVNVDFTDGISTGFVDIDAGEISSIALTNEGYVYGWGDNTQGQLAVGDKINRDAPTLVKSSARAALGNVVDICSGYKQSFFITEDGKVYGAGSGSYYQLGTTNTGTIQYATIIPTLNGKNIKKASAARNFSVMLSSEGDVYTFGRNINGVSGAYSTDANVDSDALNEDASLLNEHMSQYDVVDTKIDLPNKISWGNGSSVVWESSNEGCITTAGVVTRPSDKDAIVHLTATLTNNGNIITRKYTVVVPAVYYINLIVKEEAPGDNPISGADVILEGTSDFGEVVYSKSLTGVNGTTGFNGISKGTYKLTVTKDSGYEQYKNDNFSVPVSGDTFPVELERKDATIGITVKDGDGKEITDATLSWTGPKNGSNQKGNYTIKCEKAWGEYIITATDEDGNTGTAMVEVGDGNLDPSVEITIETHSFSVKVTDGTSKKNIDDAIVTIKGTSNSGKQVNTTFNTVDGTVSFNKIPCGTYKLVVTKDSGYKQYEVDNFSVPVSGDTFPVELEREDATIGVTVKDGNGKEITDATLSWTGASEGSNEKGNYTIDCEKAWGEYAITATDEDGNTGKATVEVGDGNLDVDVEITIEVCSFSVKVTDADDSTDDAAIDNATVTIYSKSTPEEIIATGNTNNGVANFERIPYGTYKLVATKDSGYTEKVVDNFVIPTAETQYDVSLTRKSATIDVTVKDGEDYVPDAVVTWDGPTKGNATTDKNGHYTINCGTEWGKYTITVKKDGYTTDTRTVNVGDGNLSPSNDFTIEKIVQTFTVSVTDSANSDVRVDGATVTLSNSAGTVSLEDKGSGNYEATDVLYGTYKLEISKENYFTKTAEIVIPLDGEPPVIEISIDPFYSIIDFEFIDLGEVEGDTPFDELELPHTITVHIDTNRNGVYNEGEDRTEIVPVTWNESDYNPTPEETTEETIYGTADLSDLTGVYNPKNLQPIAKVVVNIEKNFIDKIMPLEPMSVRQNIPLAPNDRTFVNTGGETFFVSAEDIPSTVTVLLKDDTTQDIGVTWDISTYNPYNVGEQTLVGTLELPDNVKNPDNLVPELNINTVATEYFLWSIEDKVVNLDVDYGTTLEEINEMLSDDDVGVEVDDVMGGGVLYLFSRYTVEDVDGIYNPDIPGTYNLTGVLGENILEFTAVPEIPVNISVKPPLKIKEIETSYADGYQCVPVEDLDNLPDYVTVVLEDDSTASVEVEWSYEDFDECVAGDHFVYGELVNLPKHIVQPENPLTPLLVVNVIPVDYKIVSFNDAPHYEKYSGLTLDEIMAGIEDNHVNAVIKSTTPGIDITISHQIEFILEDSAQPADDPLKFDPYIPNLYILYATPILPDNITNPDNVTLEIFIHAIPVNIVSIEPIHIVVNEGTEYSDIVKPQFVTATLANGKTCDLEVIWNDENDYSPYLPEGTEEKSVSYTINGEFKELPEYIGEFNSNPKPTLEITVMYYRVYYIQSITPSQIPETGELEVDLGSSLADIYEKLPIHSVNLELLDNKGDTSVLEDVTFTLREEDNPNYDGGVIDTYNLVGHLSLPENIENPDEHQLIISVKTMKYTIISVDSVRLTGVISGTPFEEIGLPETSNANLNTGEKRALKVEWDGSAYNPTKIGAQAVRGKFTQLPISIENPKDRQPVAAVTIVNPTLRVISAKEITNQAMIMDIINRPAEESIPGYTEVKYEVELQHEDGTITTDIISVFKRTETE